MPLQVITIPECAEILKVSSSDVFDLISKNELHAKKIGADYRIPTHSLDRYLGIETNYEIQEILEKIVRQTAPPTITHMLIHDLLEDVLALKARAVTSNTFEWLRGISKLIDTRLGTMYVDALTPKIVQEFYNTVSVYEDGRLISKRYMIGICNMLQWVIVYALENKYLIESPITSTVKIPPCAEVDPHERFMDYDELIYVLDILKEAPLYTTLVKLMVMSGLRIGEVAGLYWSDIDFEQSTIHVRRAVIRDYYAVGDKMKSRFIIDRTKTVQSVRDIPVTSEVITLLKNWKFDNNSCQQQNPFAHGQKSQQLVFQNKYGEHHNLNTLRTSFRCYIKRNGGDHLSVTFHRLRHSYGSFLLEQGEELITVSRLLGHKNIHITADIYCTVTKRLKLQAAEKTRNIWEKLHSI